MALKKNQVVTISFVMKDNTGLVIEETTKSKPFAFISGSEQVLPKLEENIGEMLIGSKRTVIISPEEAYGQYSDSMIQNVKRSEFPSDVTLEEGMDFIADTPDGRQMPFIIRNIDGDNITLDFNHPLAGQTLTFDVELISLRDATSEEISHGHIHVAGGHHH